MFLWGDNMDKERIMNTFDFELDENGDLVLTNGHTGDLAVVTGLAYLIQQIEIRLKGCEGEQADLEELLGMRNTPDVAEKGKSKIIRSLTYDGLLSHDDVYVEVVPVSPESLIFFVFIRTSDTDDSEEPIGFEVRLHLSYGAQLRRIS